MALRSLIFQLLVISVFTGVLVSQEPSAASTADPWILPVGTVIHLHNLTNLSSKWARAGDVVSFEVTDPVESRGLVIIPKYALATGRIVRADHSHLGGKSGDLAIDIERVQAITGAIIKVSSFVELTKKTQKSGAKTAGEVATVVASLPIMVLAGEYDRIAPGAEKQIPAGSDFSAQTIDPVPLAFSAISKLQVDFSATGKLQKEDPFAAAHSEVVICRPTDNRGQRDPKRWEIECGGDHVATIGEEQFARFFVRSGNYWLKSPGKSRTIEIEKEEIPKSELVHMEPNSRYVFRFQTSTGLFRSSLGRAGYILLDGVGVGENHFSNLRPVLLDELLPEDTSEKSRSNACGWGDIQQITAERLNGFSIIDGTPIELQLTQDWFSETAKVGEKVSLALSHDLEVSHVPMLTTGDIVDAIVSIPDVPRPEKYKGPYALIIPSLTLPDGQRVLVRSTKTMLRYGRRTSGALIADGISGHKNSVLHLARGTGVTIYVEGNYLVEPGRTTMKAPVESLMTK